MIAALGSLSGTSWGAVVACALAAGVAAGAILAVWLGSRDTTGIDAEDAAAQAELNARYAPPVESAEMYDVEETPEDEVEIPFEPLHDKPAEWAEERLAQIRQELKLTYTPEPDRPGWLPTPPEVAEALSSGSGVTNMTRGLMRKLRMELGEEAIR